MVGPWTLVLQHGEGGAVEHIATSGSQSVIFRMAEEMMLKLKSENNHHNKQALILDRNSANNPQFDLSKMPVPSKGVLI